MVSPYIEIIEGYEDLVEINIVNLLNETLKKLNKEVIFSDTEKRFYLYKDGFWNQSENTEVVSTLWRAYTTKIFPELVSMKKTKFFEQLEAEKVEDKRTAKECKRVVARYDFFIKFTQNKVKTFVESLSMSCDRIPDMNYNKIPLQNGYIDLEKNFEFFPLTPSIYNRYILDFNYVETNEEPKVFLTFLEQVLPSEEDREFLLNWLAYLLVIGNYRQKALFLHGSGRNGKGVLSRIMYKLLGSQNCSTLTVPQLSADKYFLGQLNNKLANFSPDSDDNDKIDLGAFKTITGNDNITVRDIYNAPFSMIYQGKLVFSINKVPYFSTKDLAIMERVEILNFPVTIKEEDRIPDLENKILDSEGDLIFSFLLNRVKELSEINFKFKAPQSVRDFTVEIMDEQDNISNFIVDYLNDNEDEVEWTLALTSFYNKYKEFSSEANYKILNRTNFKESVMRWASRRKDIKVIYQNNGKNYVFEFVRQTTKRKLSDIPIIHETINSDGKLVDESGNELF